MRPRLRDLGFFLIFVNALVHSVSFCDSPGTSHGYFLTAHSLECAENVGLILVARGGRGLDPSDTKQENGGPTICDSPFKSTFRYHVRQCNLSLGPGVKVRCKQG